MRWLWKGRGMEDFPTSLRPLVGGDSGETFLAEAAGEQVVVRVYGSRSLQRGPLAPEIDAAVLELVRGLLPVPEVLEVRRGDPDLDLPGLLVTRHLPGERLDVVLPDLDDRGRETLGAHLGVLVGRLGHLAQPRAGMFADRLLVPQELSEHQAGLTAWVEWHAERLGEVLPSGLSEGLREVAEHAQDLLAEDRRVCLVHADLNPENLLVDARTLEVTGLVDWEFAHAGSPYADLGNLLRFEREPVLAEAVIASYRDFMPASPHDRDFMPASPPDVLDRARAADLFALVDLAARAETTDRVEAARTRLAAVAGPETCTRPERHR